MVPVESLHKWSWAASGKDHRQDWEVIVLCWPFVLSKCKWLSPCPWHAQWFWIIVEKSVRGSGQLVPKTAPTQDNSYPGHLVPKTTRYPGQLVPRTPRTHDNSHPRRLVPRTTRTQDNSYPRRLVPSTTRNQDNSIQVVPRTTRIQDKSYAWQAWHGQLFTD